MRVCVMVDSARRLCVLSKREKQRSRPDSPPFVFSVTQRNVQKKNSSREMPPSPLTSASSNSSFRVDFLYASRTCFGSTCWNSSKLSFWSESWSEAKKLAAQLWMRSRMALIPARAPSSLPSQHRTPNRRNVLCVEPGKSRCKSASVLMKRFSV